MNNINRDYKKIISAIAFIGLLCLFVGVASRIRQNRQRTLADLSSGRQPASSSIDTGQQSASSSIDAGQQSASSSIDAGQQSASSSIDANNPEAADALSQTNSVSHDSATDSGNGSTPDITVAEYNSFFYIDNPDNTSTVYILYFNLSHRVEKGSLVCSSDNAYDILLAFYRLYKNEYEFASVKPLSEYENEAAARLANNTFCIDNRLFINPKYNPSISYSDDTMYVFPESSADYSDRSKDFPYKITTEDFAYRLLLDMGFIWGGDRNGSKDYSCFTK